MGPQRAKMLLLGSVLGPGLCGSLPLVQENGQPCPTPQASAQVSSGAFSLAPSSALITLLLPRVLPVFLSLCPLSPHLSSLPDMLGQVSAHPREVWWEEGPPQEKWLGSPQRRPRHSASLPSSPTLPWEV